MKLSFAFAALPALLLAAPALAVTAPTLSTYYFTGNCQDCDPANTPATAVLTLQNYTPGDLLADANFVSLTYHSNIQDFASTPDGGSFPYFYSNFLSGRLGAAQGSYDVSFTEDAAFFIFGGTRTTFDTGVDGSFAYNQTDLPGLELPLFDLDHGNRGLWNLGTPPVVSGAVPEPATWASMIAGFALVGAGLRRRRARVTFA